MRHENCKFAKDCEMQCKPYIKMCEKFVKSVILETVQKSGITFNAKVQHMIGVVKKDTMSPHEALASLITAVSANPRPVRFYNFNTAVACSLDNEIPLESIVFINSYNKYNDPVKQYMAIASLISACEEQGKLVIHLHKADYNAI